MVEPAREIRVALTVEDYEKSLAFYRNVLGLSLIQEWPFEEGHGALLSLENATLEILDKAHSAWVDRMEAGRQQSGQVRLAVQFQDLAAAMQAATAAGARLIRGPTETPWKDLSARLLGPDGIQMTFFKKPG